MWIVAVVVTSGRPRQIGDLLQALDRQTPPADSIIVVENVPGAATGDALGRHPRVRHVVSHRNLGGAGGFALGILTALAEGATHVWLMDDDGLPEQPNCLGELVAQGSALGAAVTSPVIVDIDDGRLLAFPYFLGRRRLQKRSDLDGAPVIRHFAHLFNGALITAEAFERFGIPDVRLFLRGDEVDFLKRVVKGGGLVATLPDVAYRHPSGNAETFPIIGGRLNAVVPTGRFKQYHFFRNRGYILRRHKALLQALSDMVRYPWYYIVSRRGDWRGLAWWLGRMAEGWREDFKPYRPPAFDPVPAFEATGAPPDPLVVGKGTCQDAPL